MKKFISTCIILTMAVSLVGCGEEIRDNEHKLQSVSDTQSSGSISESERINESKINIINELDTLVSETGFIRKTDEEQQREVQDILNNYVGESVIKAGTISFDKTTRTFNFIYTDNENGFYSLSSIKYAVNNQDNLVWQGEEPILNEPDITEKTTETNKNDELNLNDSDKPNSDKPNSSKPNENNMSNENNSNTTVTNNADNSNNITNNDSTYIIGIKLNYNNATGFIQGRFITSNGGAYAFDFTDKYTMMDLDLIEQLTNIIETRTCTYGVDAYTLNNLIQLSNSIDYTAELYQTVGDTQQDITSEVIYTYNKKTNLLVECCSSGVKESHLDDTDADAFAIALIDAIDNKVQRLNR